MTKCHESVQNPSNSERMARRMNWESNWLDLCGRIVVGCPYLFARLETPLISLTRISPKRSAFSQLGGK